MKCNYKPPKLTKEEQQEFASVKSTLSYIDRLQIQQRNGKKARAILDHINRQQEQLEAAANGQETLQKALAEETKKREVQAERLREEREQKYEQIDLICSLRNELAEKDKELIRLNKEVDRLSQYVLYNEEYINDHYWDFCSISGCERVSNDCWKTCPYSRYSKVKSKIIKDFAERLKRECLIDRGYEILHEGTIDNLVKEMTEVDE